MPQTTGQPEPELPENQELLRMISTLHDELAELKRDEIARLDCACAKGIESLARILKATQI